MKIGMRTIKTAISASLAIICAQFFGLLYPTAAGIIALLSVTNTKKSSVYVGVSRVGSLVLATSLAFICFHLFGYNAGAFGVYLLFFIPLAAKWHMPEGIPVSSVLITHYLIEERMDVAIISNAFFLMFLGVGFAILANLYMPNMEKQLRDNQQEIDKKIRHLLQSMVVHLKYPTQKFEGETYLIEMETLLKQAEKWAKNHGDNSFFSNDNYYLDYFNMRKLQVSILKQMTIILTSLEVAHTPVAPTVEVLAYASQTFAEENDGQSILNKIDQTLQSYSQSSLPKDREEFENRSKLFQFLHEFHRFIEVKADFYEEHQPTVLEKMKLSKEGPEN
ncbi:aromatic acid exporter family protein [Vagococcus humatus]|uniref:Putative aromatic acid exporter C-terminal domain-containing protein n=1 Tax=Vagococcus humatus TaxID=1889241 RepID=A0A429Z980_9ENTE|nr:aromatic acid exporter family protein [Vagococcus humatus]RST90267.1 hypothetical protein C7P63_04115 [Vagococcus humatus]